MSGNEYWLTMEASQAIERLAKLEKNLPLEELKEAMLKMAEYISQYQPDFIITLGESALISRLLLTIVKSLNKKIPPVIRLGNETNVYIYKVTAPNPTEDERVEHLADVFFRLKLHYPNLTPQAKFLFVDEFIDTGAKTIGTLLRAHQIGLTKVRFAAFAGPNESDDHLHCVDKNTVLAYLEVLGPNSELKKAKDGLKNGEIKIDWKNDVFLASSNSNLQNHLLKMAKALSENRKIFKNKQQDEIYFGEGTFYVRKQVAQLLKNIKKSLKGKL